MISYPFQRAFVLQDGVEGGHVLNVILKDDRNNSPWKNANQSGRSIRSVISVRLVIKKKTAMKMLRDQIMKEQEK